MNLEDFLKTNYMLFAYSFVTVAVVVGLISYNKYKGTPATFFIKILVYLFFIEILGSYSVYYNKYEILKPIYNSIFRQSYWWFTLFFDIGVTILFSILFQKIFKIQKNKLILKFITCAYLIFALVYLFYNKDVFFFQTFPLLQISGAIIIVCCSILYFFELFQSNSILKFYKSVYFYIASAIFVWWIIATPISFYDFYFRNGDWNFIILKWQIYLFANLIMYTTFAIGLIVSKPESNTKVEKV